MQVKPQGSFSRPDVDTKRPTPTGSFSRPAEEPKPQPAPVAEPEPPEQTDEEAAKIKRDEELIASLLKDLKITLDEDELWGLILGNTLEKRQIEIIPGMFYATFRSISMKDARYIGEQLGDAYHNKNLLDEAFKHLRIQLTLAAGVLEAGKPGKIGSLGETPQDRFEAIDGMATSVADQLSKKWGSFALLLEMLLKRDVGRGK